METATTPAADLGLPATVFYLYQPAGIAAGPFATWQDAAAYDPTDDRLDIAEMPFLAWVCLTTDRDDVRGHVPTVITPRDDAGYRTHSGPAEVCAGCTADSPIGALVPVSFCATALAVADALAGLEAW